jgi:hypothetical protein
MGFKCFFLFKGDGWETVTYLRSEKNILKKVENKFGG